ncbi:unnamed protein product [Ectocarpus sp. 13 AM-2016]
MRCSTQPASQLWRPLPPRDAQEEDADSFFFEAAAVSTSSGFHVDCSNQRCVCCVLGVLCRTATRNFAVVAETPADYLPPGAFKNRLEPAVWPVHVLVAVTERGLCR